MNLLIALKAEDIKFLLCLFHPLKLLMYLLLEQINLLLNTLKKFIL